mgnify:CR=1 FL=1
MTFAVFPNSTTFPDRENALSNSKTFHDRVNPEQVVTLLQYCFNADRQKYMLDFINFYGLVISQNFS